VIERHPLRSQTDAAFRAVPRHTTSTVASRAPRAVAAATTSDWNVCAIVLQAKTAFDLAAAELTASFFEAPVALPVITSAAKPRSAAIVPRRAVVTHMLNLPLRARRLGQRTPLNCENEDKDARLDTPLDFILASSHSV
jgi:hypothetical protein